MKKLSRTCPTFCQRLGALLSIGRLARKHKLGKEELALVLQGLMSPTRDTHLSFGYGLAAQPSKIVSYNT